MKKLVMVETISQFRIRHVVEVEDHIHYALDEAIMREEDPDFKEFSQQHLGVTIFDHYEISEEEYLKMFDEENSYLKDLTLEQKLNYINKLKQENN
jgi:hypothetical protein